MPRTKAKPRGREETVPDDFKEGDAVMVDGVGIHGTIADRCRMTDNNVHVKFNGPPWAKCIHASAVTALRPVPTPRTGSKSKTKKENRR